MPNTNDSHGESKIIFENDDWLIVEPFDYESYTYYAPENMKSQWNRYRDGDVYLIVDKNSQTNTGLKTYMIYINRGSTYYYLWNGNEASTKKRFINYLSDEIVEQVNNIVGEGKLYSLLVKIQNGEEVSARELEDADESIYDFKYTPKAPLKVKLLLVLMMMNMLGYLTLVMMIYGIIVLLQEVMIPMNLKVIINRLKISNKDTLRIFSEVRIL